jgi:hypothetical protein
MGGRKEISKAGSGVDGTTAGIGDDRNTGFQPVRYAASGSQDHAAGCPRDPTARMAVLQIFCQNQFCSATAQDVIDLIERIPD